MRETFAEPEPENLAFMIEKLVNHGYTITPPDETSKQLEISATDSQTNLHFSKEEIEQNQEVVRAIRRHLIRIRAVGHLALEPLPLEERIRLYD